MTRLMIGSNKSMNSNMQKILILFLLIFNIKNSLNWTEKFGCIEEYWAQLWLRSFYDGYRRRAAIGTFLDILGIKEIHYWELCLYGGVIAIFAIALIFHLNKDIFLGNRKASQLLAILLTGPTVTVFFEALGDPLQFCFIGSLCIFYLRNYISKNYISIILVIICLGLILVHEASIFIFIPALMISIFINTISLRSFSWLFALTLFLSYLFVLFFNDPIFQESSISLILSTGQKYNSVRVMPEHSELLSIEFGNMFGSVMLIKHTLGKIASSFFWPIMVCLIISFCDNSLRIFLLYATLIIISSPLYLIAHDWGRFSIYTLWMAISLFSQGISFSSEKNKFYWTLRLNEKFVNISLLYHQSTNRMNIMGIIPFLYYAYPAYRIDGLMRQNMWLMLYLFVYFYIANFWVFRDNKDNKIDALSP